MWDSEPTGKPVEGRLVGVISTKTSGWGKGSRSILQEGTASQWTDTWNNCVACVIGSCFDSSWLVFGSFRNQDVYIGSCEYVVAEYSWVKLFSCALVNLMTHKDRSRGASGVLCAFYRSCSVHYHRRY